MKLSHKNENPDPLSVHNNKNYSNINMRFVLIILNNKIGKFVCSNFYKQI